MPPGAALTTRRKAPSRWVRRPRISTPAGGKTSELYSLGKEKASHLLESGKGLLDEQRDRVAAAIEAGKQAYRDKKAEVLALNPKETTDSEPAL